MILPYTSIICYVVLHVELSLRVTRVVSITISATGPAMVGGGTGGKSPGVLDAVAAFARPARLAALHAVLPFPKATLHRLWQMLARKGMLTFDAER